MLGTWRHLSLLACHQYQVTVVPTFISTSTTVGNPVVSTVVQAPIMAISASQQGSELWRSPIFSLRSRRLPSMPGSSAVPIRLAARTKHNIGN